MSIRRESILREMGLAPLWRLRSGSRADDVEAVSVTQETVAPEGGDEAGAMVPTVLTPAAPIAVPPASVEQPRRPVRPAVVPAPVKVAPAAPSRSSTPDSARAARIAQMDWETLEADIRACTACQLCERRKQAVPGVGDRRAQWMLVGEGPGAEEDQRGEPFVGAAGKLLDAMLASIGLNRGEGVYIANTVKCRPPLNRTPESGEIAACFPYLERQIELVQPRILIALGRPAAQALLDTEVSIAASRGRAFHYRETPVVVTYHPAYLLRTPADKAKAWEDLCFARRLIA